MADKIAMPEGEPQTKAELEKLEAEARSIKNSQDLGEFIHKLNTQYDWDYGTICHAMGIAALAGAYAMEHGPQGGITGFQSGFVMWGFVQKWMQETGPMSLRRWEHMLYPQYQDEFEKTISPDLFEALQKMAREKLGEKGDPIVNDRVREHMQSIADGQVPFGYVLKDD